MFNSSILAGIKDEYFMKHFRSFHFSFARTLRSCSCVRIRVSRQRQQQRPQVAPLWLAAIHVRVPHYVTLVLRRHHRIQSVRTTLRRYFPRSARWDQGTVYNETPSYIHVRTCIIIFNFSILLKYFAASAYFCVQHSCSAFSSWRPPCRTLERSSTSSEARPSASSPSSRPRSSTWSSAPCRATGHRGTVHYTCGKCRNIDKASDPLKTSCIGNAPDENRDSKRITSAFSCLCFIFIPRITVQWVPRLASTWATFTRFSVLEF